MNISLKTLTAFLSISMTIGGIVWASSSLHSKATMNTDKIVNLMSEQKETRNHILEIREDLAGIKAELRVQTRILKGIEVEVNK